MLIFPPRWSSLLQLPLAPSLVQIVFLCVVGSSHGDSSSTLDLFASSLWIQLQWLENQGKVWARALYHWFFMLRNCPGTVLSHVKLPLIRQSLGMAGGITHIRENTLLGYMFKIKLGLVPAFLHCLPKLSLDALSPWLSPTCPQAKATTCNAYPEFHANKTITSWDTTILTYFELEHTQKRITNEYSGHLRGHRAMKFTCGWGQPFCLLIYLAAET